MSVFHTARKFYWAVRAGPTTGRRTVNAVPRSAPLLLECGVPDRERTLVVKLSPVSCASSCASRFASSFVEAQDLLRSTTSSAAGPGRNRKGRQFPGGLLVNAGNHLRSHTLTRAVPSAQRGLTSVFGMGTGVTLAVYSPANLGVLRRAVSPSRVLKQP